MAIKTPAECGGLLGLLPAWRHRFVFFNQRRRMRSDAKTGVAAATEAVFIRRGHASNRVPDGLRCGVPRSKPP